MFKLIVSILFIYGHLLVIISGGNVKTKVIRIGGIFSVFKDTAGTVIDQTQLENLHAFLLAIEEVNNRTDILRDHFIEYVIRSPIPDSFVSIGQASLELIKNNVTGVVGSLDNFGTDASNKYFGEFKITQSHSVAMGTEFGMGEIYPYKVQTVPIDSFQGMALQNLLCKEYNVERFIVVASSDLPGQKFSIESHDDTYCSMNVPETLLAPPYQDDFTEFILAVRDEDPTVILLSLPPAQAALFLEQAYELGMLHKGVQILTDVKTTQSDIFKSFSTGAYVENIMNGVISIQFWPEHFVYLEGGKKFIQSWRKQISTKTACSSNVDATGYKFLTSEDGSTCVGLDFSTYFANGTNMNAYSPYTYDATYVLLHGLNDLLYQHTTYKQSDLHFLIMNNTNFEGATGLVDIYEGMPDLGNYAEGDREVGHYFKILNYNHNQYLINPNQAFVQVGTFSIEYGYNNLCTDVQPCIDQMKYNTHDNIFPDAYPPYQKSSYPDAIKLGGLFSPFRQDNSIDWAQVENLNAFLLAVNQINDKTDGIWDDILPHSRIVTMINGEGYDFSRGAMAAQKLLGGFGGTGVHGVVSALQNVPSYATDQVSVSPQLVIMHSVITDADFGNGATYSMKVQTSPIDTFQAMSLQKILCNAPFNVKKLGVFSSYDYFGTKSAIEIADGTYCSLTLLSTTFVYQLDKENFSEEIEHARAGGATYFAIFLPASTTAKIIEQGNEMGLFHEEIQLLGVKENTNSDLIKHFKNKEKIPQYMKGFIGLEWWSDYAFYLENGKQFMAQWKAQPSTKFDFHQGAKHCFKHKDDESNFFLYEHQTNTSLCTGLDYSGYADDGSTFTSKQVLQTYDATVAMAQGFHLLQKFGHENNGNNLINEIMTNVTFEGASGHVKLYEGMVDFGYYARGDREEGHFYKIWNFNSKSFLENNDNPFALNHVWTVEDSFLECPKTLECVPITYRSSNNQPVSDTQPDVIIPMEPWIVIMLYSFGVIAFAVIVFYSFILWKYRNSRLLKASQAPMLYIMMFGEVLGVGKILIAASPITTPTCIGGLWSAHLGFFLVFATCLIKLWRVNKLVNNKSLKRMKITTTHILQILATIMFGVVALLILLTFVGKPHLSYQETTIANETTKYPYCAYEYPEFQILFYVIELLLLCYGVSLCWAIKDIPDAINESQAIAMAMAIIAAACYMSFPIILSQPPRVNQVIAGVGFFVGVMVILFCVFYPKGKILLAGKDLMKDLTIGYVENKKSKTKKEKHVKIHPMNEGVFLGKTKDPMLGKYEDNDYDPVKSSSSKSVNNIHNLEQQIFVYPTMNQIPGTREEKLRTITDYVDYWIQLKKTAEQQVLAHASENSRSSRESSCVATPLNSLKGSSHKGLIRDNFDKSDQV